MAATFGDCWRGNRLREHGGAHILSTVCDSPFTVLLAFICAYLLVLQLRSLYAVSLSAMAVTAARRCMVSLLLSWPDNVQLSSSTVSGEDNLVMLSKIVVAGTVVQARSMILCAIR